MAARITIVLVAALTAIFFMVMFERAYHYEQNRRCWITYEDGSAFNPCTGKRYSNPDR